MKTPKVVLIMAGGTGGHIFPGLAIAKIMRQRGWSVQWLGAPDSMESRLVPEQGFVFNAIEFSGVRGKGWFPLLQLPWHLCKAFWQSIDTLRKLKPQIVIGFGGYVTFPTGVITVLMGKSLLLHEQNAIAGMSNRVLALMTKHVFTAFPHVFKAGIYVGNPMRIEFTQQVPPDRRYASRQGPLRLLVMGGSLGAKALNELIPRALSRIPLECRPEVTHQGGEKQFQDLLMQYQKANVNANLTPFITNPAQALAHADLVICRAGASTVSEIAAIGVAALFIPFPYAVDDHQTQNAHFLSQHGAAMCVQQKNLTIDFLINLLQHTEREKLAEFAIRAKAMQKIEASEKIADACDALVIKAQSKGEAV